MKKNKYVVKVANYIVEDWFSYLLAMVSASYGYLLIAHPDILQTYSVYQRVRDVFDHRFIGLFFITIGVSYGLCTVMKWQKARQLLLSGITFIWIFFGLSFVFTEPPNTIGLLCFGMAGVSFGISVRGGFGND